MLTTRYVRKIFAPIVNQIGCLVIHTVLIMWRECTIYKEFQSCILCWLELAKSVISVTLSRSSGCAPRFRASPIRNSMLSWTWKHRIMIIKYVVIYFLSRVSNFASGLCFLEYLTRRCQNTFFRPFSLFTSNPYVYPYPFSKVKLPKLRTIRAVC